MSTTDEGLSFVNNSLEDLEASVIVARPDISISYCPGRSRSQKRKASGHERTGSRIRSWKRAMIRRKPETSRPSYLSTPPPDTSPRSSCVISDWDADDEETMSMEDVRTSRPSSVAVDDSNDGHYYPQRPTLPDVLSNCAPPPWTLSAFTAYLSQNHCLENLEFSMDAERYREKYLSLTKNSRKPTAEEARYTRGLWQRLIDAYIIPDGPREINLPSSVRDRLLSVPNHTTPPPPEELASAVKIIYNLMEESVLISFLNEVPPSGGHSRQKSSVKSRRRGDSDSSNEKASNRNKSRRRASPTTSLDSSFSGDRSDPTGRLTPIPAYTKCARAPSHTSGGDPDLMTDDSTGASSPGREPMTPPNTPPSSDFGGHSPRNRNDNSWKKMFWKKKSSNGMRDSRYPTLED